MKSALFALSSLAAFLVTLPAAPVSALAVKPAHSARQFVDHSSLARGKRMRGAHKRSCIKRPAPSADTSGSADTGDSSGDSSSGAPSSDGSGDSSSGASAPSSGDSSPSSDPTDTSGDGSNTDSSPSGDSGDQSDSGDQPGGSADGSSGDPSSGGSSTDQSGGSTGGSSSTPSGGSSIGTSSNGKKGLAFPDDCSNIMQWSPNVDTHWHYNWRSAPYGDCPSGAPEYVPMLWGPGNEDQFISDTNANPPKNCLHWNEPNLCDNPGLSSCGDPNSAVSSWWKAMEPLKSNYGTRLGSAAPTSAPDGLTWLQNFSNACSGCHIDFIVIHWYGTNPQDFFTYATGIHNAFPDKPIWITEMADMDFNGGTWATTDDVWNFISEISHWCETTSWIERYTFFGAMTDLVNVNTANALMDVNTHGPNSMGAHMLASY